MKYPKIPDFHELAQLITYYAKHKHEYGAKNVETKLDSIYNMMEEAYKELKQLPVDNAMSIDQPDSLQEIKKRTPDGPRRLWKQLDSSYETKLKGAFIARIAGCILGAPVEFHSVKEMEEWASYNNEVFPPVDYWTKIKAPGTLRYQQSDFKEYTKQGMTKAPVDDDIVYTILNLLVVEEYGHTFTTEDVAKAWVNYLPYACTAEEVTLKNLKEGISPNKAAELDNPYIEWIGADIRSDAFAYIAPGYPEKAAEMAYYDAFLSHRRNGIYGEMFFAAAQSAAFAVDDPIKAIEIGLTEIPEHCTLAKDIRWALSERHNINNYQDARDAVEKRFKGMEHAHTNNNACLTVFGLHIGDTDVTSVIGQTVAMGMDNDCTAASAGSIVGAIATFDNISPNWYNNFNDIVDTYLINVGELKISDVLMRFHAQAKNIFDGGLN